MNKIQEEKCIIKKHTILLAGTAAAAAASNSVSKQASLSSHSGMLPLYLVIAMLHLIQSRVLYLYFGWLFLLLFSYLL